MTGKVQSRAGIKAQVVHMSLVQLLSAHRIQRYFADQFQLQVNNNLIVKFIKEAYQALAQFEQMVIQKLSDSAVAYVSEQRLDVKGGEHWLYCVSNGRWTLFSLQEKREIDAYYNMGLFPGFRGVLCHDPWDSYFKLDCQHALCNDQIMADLAKEAGQDRGHWSKEMMKLLKAMNASVNDSGGVLKANKRKLYRATYRKLIKKGIIETIHPSCLLKRGTRNFKAKPRSQELLHRLQKYENNILMFMKVKEIESSGNFAKADIKRIKLQSKKSNRFLAGERARIFGRVQSYLISCRKQGMKSNFALEKLFKGKLPNLK